MTIYLNRTHHYERSRMKSTMYSFLLIILLSFSKALISQDAVTVLDRVYGLDQTLCNGKKYNYIPFPGTTGYQYLFSPYYSVGRVVLKGKCYQGIALNYDIFNQQLLLQYDDESGTRNIIEVSKGWLTRFSLGNMNFEFLNLEQNPRFFQVLGEGPVRILYYWWKNVNLDATIGNTHFTFTPAVRDSYVFMNGQLKRFRTKRDLIGLFDPGHRPEIKSYMRKNKIKLKKASDQVMAEMITFIGSIR